MESVVMIILSYAPVELKRSNGIVTSTLTTGVKCVINVLIVIIADVMLAKN
jgi:hypothetical protein